MKRYGYTKTEIADVLTKLILSPGIKMLDEEVILKALSDFVSTTLILLMPIYQVYQFWRKNIQL